MLLVDGISDGKSGWKIVLLRRDISDGIFSENVILNTGCDSRFRLGVAPLAQWQ